MPTACVKPQLIQWAVERSRLPGELLLKRFPKLEAWKSGEKQPTFRQLELFAKNTRTPLGYFFLPEPPVEAIRIPDFRTVGDTPIDRPSPDLIDTIHAVQLRQNWMREFSVEDGQEPIAFVGEGKGYRSPSALANKIRACLGLRTGWAEQCRSWEEALGLLRSVIEGVGILVFTSSIVGNNTHRLLDPDEFRGFVLCDSHVPAIFVNSGDSKSAQMFTLAHELVHIWTGSDGLFNLVKMLPSSDASERFCNQVAAELLVPVAQFKDRWSEFASSDQPFDDAARVFKVSPLVIARRALDLRVISRPEFFRFYERYQEKWIEYKALRRAKKGGGDFYKTQASRLGRRFSRAVVRAVLENRLLYREAYRLTGLKGNTFERYAGIVQERIRDERE